MHPAEVVSEMGRRWTIDVVGAVHHQAGPGMTVLVGEVEGHRSRCSEEPAACRVQATEGCALGLAAAECADKARQSVEVGMAWCRGDQAQ